MSQHLRLGESSRNRRERREAAQGSRIASPSRPVILVARVCMVTGYGTSTLRDPILQLIGIEGALSSEPYYGDQCLASKVVHSCRCNPESLRYYRSLKKAFSGWHRFSEFKS